MKKKTIITVICMAMVICMISSVVITTSATPVTGKFYNLDTQYTAITRVYCYSEANFTGNYYGENSSSNNILISGGCRGGDIDEFNTTLYRRLTDAVNVRIIKNKTSSTQNNRILEDTIERPSNDIIPTANGYVEQTCRSKTSSSDKWEANYLYRWVGAQAGWVET